MSEALSDISYSDTTEVAPMQDVMASPEHVKAVAAKREPPRNSFGIEAEKRENTPERGFLATAVRAVLPPRLARRVAALVAFPVDPTCSLANERVSFPDTRAGVRVHRRRRRARSRRGQSKPGEIGRGRRPSPDARGGETPRAAAAATARGGRRSDPSTERVEPDATGDRADEPAPSGRRGGSRRRRGSRGSVRRGIRRLARRRRLQRRVVRLGARGHSRRRLRVHLGL